jgi:DNA-binding NarL/FixJ family response regulator
MADRIAELLAEEQQLHLRLKTIREEIDAEIRRIHQATAVSLGNRYTEREQQIATLVRQRMRNKQIADQLNIAERTVKFHISSMLAKMNVKTRLDL